MSKVIVEICCGSADDVIQAKKAGAARVELNSCLFLGGLTPSIGEFKIAKKQDIEIMAMVRPREGGFCYTDAEFETMLADAEALLEAGADGIVFGFLHEDGTIDIERCRTMMKLIGNKQSVFHRAIDVVPDWRATLDALIGLGITRTLTSGQQPSVLAGAQTIREMIERAGDRIQILPGGDITHATAQAVIQKTGCTQIHAAVGKLSFDNSTAFNRSIHFGGALYPPENVYTVTDCGGVENLIRLASDI